MSLLTSIPIFPIAFFDTSRVTALGQMSGKSTFEDY